MDRSHELEQLAANIASKLSNEDVAELRQQAKGDRAHELERMATNVAAKLFPID